jgi:hypothetical protein
MSNDTDTRVVDLVVTRNSAAVTANIDISGWNTPFKDSHAFFNSTTGVYTIGVPGDYFVSLTSFIPNAGSCTGSIIYNSAGQAFTNLATAANTRGNVSVLIPNAKVGDSISLRSDISVTLAADLKLTVHRLSGPATIAASESVNARYSTVVGQSITNGATPVTVVFGTKDFDSHNAMNSATGVFTAPISGVYRISSIICFTAASFTYSSTSAIELYVLKNGSSYNEFGYTPVQVTQSIRIGAQGSSTIKLNAGDTLAVGVTHGESSPRSLLANAGLNWVSIERIGN